MAANLDYSNDRVNYAYVKEHGSVWHGEGNVLPLHAPLTEWKKEAGLEWEAIPSPITFNDAFGKSTTFPDKVVLSRSDNGAPLSIVSDSYQIVQPAEVVDFFADLLDKHDMEMSSCGSLFDGKRFFATAKLNDIEIVSGDKITGYLLIATSLDGTLATTAKTTTIRTVCNNTLTMAMNESSANMIKVPHSTEFNASKAKLNLGLIEESQFTFIENMKKLVNTRISDEDALAFYKETFYNKEFKEQEQHGTVVKKVNDIMTLYKFGNGSNYAPNTLYQVLQGVTDHYTHGIRNRTESAKFWNNFYGSAEKTKLDVQNKLLKMAA